MVALRKKAENHPSIWRDVMRSRECGLINYGAALSGGGATD